MVPTRRAAQTLILALLPAAVGAAPAPDGEALGGFDCLLQPYALTELSTREEGVIERIDVSRGELITQGQALVRLQSDVEEAAVALLAKRAQMSAEIEDAQVGVEFAERRLERIAELYASNAISFNDQDEAETEAARARLQLRRVMQEQAIAELELERARKQLSLRTIRSPIDGVVVERMLGVGESVENLPILKVAQVDPLNVEIIVPVRWLGAIEVGMAAEVTPLYPGAEPQLARVELMDRVVDAASNTFGVRLELPNPDYAIPGGVRCDIRFLADD
ncbi:MAG TPA: efflux RND transporter periplasmic adaptor subunit [Pseudomonadales bacterium]|nr:efflux RND transporter periplasmic adaptor subunit [Pseudomonadales bacterium]